MIIAAILYRLLKGVILMNLFGGLG